MADNLVHDGPPKTYIESVENRLQRVENALKSVATPVIGKLLEGSLKNEDSVDLVTEVSISAPYTTDYLNSQIDRFTINEIGQAIYVNDLYTRVDRIPPNNKSIRSYYYDTQPDISSVSDSPRSSAATSFSSNFFPLETPIKEHLGADKKTISEMEPLIEIYFDHVHKYIPMIHKPSFMKQLQGTGNPPSRLLLYAIGAVASRWTVDRADYNKLIPPGYTYYQKALGSLDDFFNIPRVSTIQALILLVKYQEYFQKVGYFHRSYAYLGIAARMCFDLGLSDADGDSIEAEVGKRTFWVAFTYDLLMSIEQGRATYFDASKCATSYPSATAEETSVLEDAIMNQNAFIQLCKILSVTYSVVRRFTVRQQVQGNQRTKEQTIEEQSWLFSIHTHLENFFYEISQDPQGSFGESQMLQDPYIGFLYMTYQFCVILLHRNYIERTLDVNEHDFIPYPHRNLCYNAAASITNIVETLQQRFPLDVFILPIRGVQHVIHCLAAAGTVHQYELLHTEDSAAKDVARRRHVLTLNMTQSLSRHSPSLETLKFFNTPIHSLRRRPMSACFHDNSNTSGSNRRARPVSMTFLENQTGWMAGNAAYPMQQMANRYSYSQQQPSIGWPGLAYLDLQNGPLVSYPFSEQQGNEELSSPINYQEQQMQYNPIPSMNDLFLIDSEENQDTVMEM
ncbi:hypothetical protein G6F35_005451 [Rhizopus arrhizus]|nr:hypothetical protein G6F35_005451 [Rhizopus arrhizus]